MEQKTFDFIIVGGGTAGCVLASRLSLALPHFSILLIEAGPKHDDRVAPSMGLAAADGRNIQWNNRTIPQKQLNGRTMSQEQGKILGGSSAINYQTWTRGAAAEFDRWALEVGDERWSWRGILPYFKKTETFVPGTEMRQEDDPVNHGYCGPIKIAHVSSSGRNRQYPLKSMVADIYAAANVARILDGNKGQTIGFSELASNTFNGERQLGATSYPRGPNVMLWDSTQTVKILFQGTKAVGVEVLGNDHGPLRAMANKEVIVCSGVQGSAKLLLLSGIGPKAELNRHNIPNLVDIPVGENYSDHPSLATFWKLRDRNLSLGDMEMVTSHCDWTAGCPCDWLGYHRHDDEDLKELAKKCLTPLEFERFELSGRPHTESFVMYGHFDLTHNAVSNPGGSVFTMINVVATPASRGTIRLSSPDPLSSVLIDPAVFENPIDAKLLYACAAMTSRAISNSSATHKYGAVEYGVPEEMQGDFSDEAMRARLLRTAENINHGGGTCAMGSVVDTECRVLGTQGLRVVDASVMPFPIGAHYQAVVYAIAEQIADVIVNSNSY